MAHGSLPLELTEIVKPMIRLDIKKTYKLYIGGAFPRTESGRYYKLEHKGQLVANLCLASRKDFRNAVVAARKAQDGWASKTGYNRGQILYRIAEMLKGRAAQFVEELIAVGAKPQAAKQEVMDAIDTWVYYAGWCDKYQQLASSVNPVASPHFNFTAPEPTGVVAAVAPADSGLRGLTRTLAPIVASGNTVIALAAEQFGHVALSLAEVIHSSDVPGGVVNLLTGNPEELLPHMAGHMDVDAIALALALANDGATKSAAAANVKRVVTLRATDGLENITDFVEYKTTWHPIGA